MFVIIIYSFSNLHCKKRDHCVGRDKPAVVYCDSTKILLHI